MLREWLPFHVLACVAFSARAVSSLTPPSASPAARSTPRFQSRTRVRAAEGGAEPAGSAPAEARRERKNKYAQFSLADDEYGAKLERGELGGPVELKSRLRRRPPTSRGPSLQTRERGVVQYPDASSVDPTDPSTFGFCEIGRIIGAHGVHGEVKVQSDTDFAVDRLCTPGVRYLKTPRRRAPREVVVSAGCLAKTLKEGQGAVYILRIEGVADREEAHALKGCTLFVRAESTPASLDRSADEYLVRELAGCSVWLMPDGTEYVGTVVGMVCADEITGNAKLGNDLLDIEKAPPPGGGRAERVFVPFVKALVPHVDIAARRIHIAPVPGLLELTQPPENERVLVRGLLPASGASSGARR